MSAKQRYWLYKAQSPTVGFIGATAMWLLVQGGNNAIGYAVGAITLLAAALVFTRVDRKNAQTLDDEGRYANMGWRIAGMLVFAAAVLIMVAHS